MNPISVEPLLQKLCQGDMDAAKQVFVAYEPFLRQFVRRQLPPRLRAKFDSIDIVQSVWADLLEGYRGGEWQFPDAPRFQAFLVQATRNRFYDRFRKHRMSLEKEQPLGNMHTSEMPLCNEPRASEVLQAEELWKEMVALCPAEHQELLRLKRQGLPMTELVERTGLHPGSIRRILRNLARDLALRWLVCPIRSNQLSMVPCRQLKQILCLPLPNCHRPPHLGEHDALVQRLVDEMIECWRQGKRTRAEHFLDLHPELWKQGPAVVDLVYEEVCLCHEHGEPVDQQEIARRFPQWRQQLEVLLKCIDALHAERTGMPRVGDTIADFQLLAELGRGGQGQVFVATQSSLGDRPVVLKITPSRGEEHLSLARLQHTHIVPLLSVIDEPEFNLRVLCMPYFGGLTLAAIMEELQHRPLDERAGKQILQVLDKARAGRRWCCRQGAIRQRPFWNGQLLSRP